MCISTSSECLEALDKSNFVLSDIDEQSLLNEVDASVVMNMSGNSSIPVLDYV